MKFGVHLPTVRLNDPDPLAMMTEFVSTSDALGYEFVAVNDHFFQVLDPVTSLVAVAGATRNMQFVPAGLLPIHRGLVPSAKMFVTLDLFTGGRVIAGIAAGSQQLEYTINNVDFAERWARFDEIAVALRSLLQQGAPAFKGKYYNTEGLDLGLMPRRPEGIPIWVGAWGSNAGLRRVARFGDGWLSSALQLTPESLRETKAKLDQYLIAEGKDPANFPNGLCTWQFYVSKDQRQIEAMNERRVAGRRDRPRPTAEGERHEMHGMGPIIGTPEQVAEVVSQLAEAGAGALFIRPLDDHLEQVQLFMSDVVPLVRQPALARS